jgi:hypothetical protein
LLCLLSIVLVLVVVLDKQSHLVCGVGGERQKTGGLQSSSNEANTPNPVQSIPLRFEDEDEYSGKTLLFWVRREKNALKFREGRLPCRPIFLLVIGAK